MKAFVKTYWLELVLFAVALVGDLMVLLLPEQVPVLWNLPARPAPKWSLLFLAVVQFPGATWCVPACISILSGIPRGRSSLAA